MAAEESESACVSVKEQNAMVRWGGDREVTHTRVYACVRVLWHGWRTAGAVAASTARLRGGWRAKTATTWLDGATTLEAGGVSVRRH
jgi:hypothetical protein